MLLISRKATNYVLLIFFLEVAEIVYERLKALSEKCKEKLVAQGFLLENIACFPYLNLRYKGTDGSLMCPSSEVAEPKEEDIKFEGFKEVFLKRFAHLKYKLSFLILLT